MNVLPMVNDKKVVVLLGAGGVGKTTSAIALAFLGAMHGKNVALLSIDPAKRLAAALGIPLGYQLSQIAWPEEFANLRVPGTEGKVFAAMLDQKAVFDSMVIKHSPSTVIAQKILRHPIYRAASTNLSGPLEYMALAKLQELVEGEIYDLIVVDTPPDTHALDFLDRPNVLAGFMEQGVMSWLIKPFVLANRFGLARLLSSSERLMGGLAKVTGLSALTSFAEFLVLAQEVISGFHKSSERILEILRSPKTGFVLVMVPTLNAARSTLNIYRELQKMGYPIDLLLINRTIPKKIKASLKHLSSDQELATNPDLLMLQAKVASQEEVINKTAMIVKAPLQKVLDEQDRDLGDFKATLHLAIQLGNEGVSSY